jgi:hypothetical protein
MRDELNYPSSSFVGSASGIHFIRFVYGVLGMYNPDKPTPGSTSVPGEDDRLMSDEGSGHPKFIWRNGDLSEVSADPSQQRYKFDDLLQWSSTYFDAWHPAFPFHHAPSILESFEIIANEGVGRVGKWQMVIAKAIFSISLADRRQSDSRQSVPMPAELVFDTFGSVLDSVQSALASPPTILGLQAVLTAQLFLVSMLRLNAASRLGGLVVRIAFQLGLHRCPTRFSSFSRDDQQLRKRIFWSVYCIERYLSNALGLPLTIRDDDVDVCHLDKEEHHPRETFVNDGAQNGSVDSRLQLLTLLSKHAKIRGSIMELRNKRIGVRDEESDKSLLINADLTQWSNEIEDFFDPIDTRGSATSCSSLHRAILETLKNECKIALSRPLLSLSKQTASYAGAIHACIRAAKDIISRIHSLDSSNEPLVWPSFTWAIWMSAFIILYAHVEGHVTELVAKRNTERSLEILRKLASRGSVWPRACAVAIEDLMVKLNKQSTGTPQPISRQDFSTSDSKRPGTATSLTQRSSSDLNRNAFLSGGDSNFIEPVRSSIPTPRPAPLLRDQSRLAQPPKASIIHNTAFTEPSSSAPTFPSGQDASSAFPWGLMPQSKAPDSWQNLNVPAPDIDMLPTESMDPFEQFDIPFWFGQDNYAAWLGR